jgi:acyl-CoA dehydrogenase
MSDAAAIAERTARFVREVVIPAEARLAGPCPTDDERRALQDSARAAGLLSPHVGTEYGGLGLDVRGQALVFEEAGYSLLGALSMNCAAPDEGNMHLLEKVASEPQKERYLRPLAAGRTRSCFAMTEPPPGAGADPAMLRTTAERTSGGYVIDGRKWFITGAHGAAFAICMARTAERIDHDEGATMFLVDADNPGMRIVREVETVDAASPGGHCEVVFERCEVPEDAILGEVGLGYRYAQVRLGPARLTHCMRFLGLARRALDIALDRASEREAFGRLLRDQGLAQHLVADAVIDIEASRGLIRRAAEALDAGEPGRHETGVAKVFVAEAVGRIVDRAVQICGGYGVSHESVLGRLPGEVRAFRVYDGPSEVHRMAIARRAFRRRDAARAAQTS